MDLWGPEKVVSRNGGCARDIHLMTVVDPATGWFKMAQLCEGEKPAAKKSQEILDTLCLARCPRPKEIGFKIGF